MSRLKLVTFDIVNTVLRVRGSPSLEYSKVANNLGINLTSQQIEAAYWPTWKLKRQKQPHYGLRQGMTSRHWWHEFVSEVCVTAGYHGDREKLGHMTDALWHRFAEGSNWEVLPEARDTLETLRSRGVTLGVISNFDERLETTLTRHDLRGYFSFLVTSASERNSKPDPRMFEAALRHGGVSADVTGHVGDDVEQDYHAARRLGISPFLLNTNNKLTQEQLEGVKQGHVINKLSDLLQFF